MPAQLAAARRRLASVRQGVSLVRQVRVSGALGGRPVRQALPVPVVRQSAREGPQPVQVLVVLVEALLVRPALAARALAPLVRPALVQQAAMALRARRSVESESRVARARAARGLPAPLAAAWELWAELGLPALVAWERPGRPAEPLPELVQAAPARLGPV